MLRHEFAERVLLPNSNISISALYASAALHILTTVPILSLLSLVKEATNERTQTLPFWAQDYSVNKSPDQHSGISMEPPEPVSPYTAHASLVRTSRRRTLLTEAPSISTALALARVTKSLLNKQTCNSEASYGQHLTLSHCSFCGCLISQRKP
jgi:hypothetical protein